MITTAFFIYLVFHYWYISIPIILMIGLAPIVIPSRIEYYRRMRTYAKIDKELADRKK